MSEMRLGVGKNFRLLLVTFFACWLLRLALAWLTGSFQNFDRRDMERLALAMVQTGTISNMMTPGVPSAGEAPAYVVLLAAIFRFFGTGALAEAIKILLCTAACSLRGVLTVWIAARFQLSRSVLIAIAALSIFWIGALNTELQGDWDPPYTAVALILLVRLQAFSPLEKRSLGRALLLGALWALGGYLNFSILAVLAGFLVRDLVVSGRRDFPRYLRNAACVSLGAFLVLLPWGVRNRVVLGQWIFTRNMLGYGLALSYHDGAHWGEPVNNHPGSDLALSPYPYLNVSLRPEVAHLGEVEWDLRQARKGLTWMAAHPLRTVTLMAQHAFFFWFPPGWGFYSGISRDGVAPYAFAKWLLTLLAIAGWFRLRALAPLAAQAMGVILVFFPLVYYLVNWSSRYRMPIEWVLVFLAGVTLGGIYDTVAAHRAATTTALPSLQTNPES
jgi:hypothetical protein